jgi:hypothetical protein
MPPNLLYHELSISVKNPHVKQGFMDIFRKNVDVTPRPDIVRGVM